MAQKKIILQVALPTPLRRLFDYLPPISLGDTHLLPGMRILVPFQSRQLVGILVAVAQETAVPKNKLKAALTILDEQPFFTAELFELCFWAADYYHASLGEVFAGAMPALFRKGKLLDDMPAAACAVDTVAVKEASLALNEAQQAAVTAILQVKDSFNTFLLDGVTGSGKTEVYLQTIAALLKTGKQILILVPEISLTPQTLQRFQARFAVPIVALHSHLTERARAQAWLLAKQGVAKLVIGTRSAVFTPFAELGLIIVDEEHDASFKQQDRFRYHARDLAIVRARNANIPILLGSATPSLETRWNAKRQRYQLLSMPDRAGKALLPQQQIIDVRQEKLDQGLSSTLIACMREHLQQENQVMLFLNRRGFAPVLLCTQCGWVAECKRCDTRLVYHRTPSRLQCHYCDAQRTVPAVCEQCGMASCEAVGLGTQRIEQSLEKYFPDVAVIRVDRDSTRRKNALPDLLTRIHTEKKAILLGTQMLAKGHHFPNVTLVGVIDADNGLFSADYRAVEQMGQLLVQVAGRAGRAEKTGTVLIQTRYPDHPLLQTLLHQGYGPFADSLGTERENALLPPFASLAILRAEAHTEAAVFAFLTAIRDQASLDGHSVSLLGPVPAPLFKRQGLYRAQLWVKAARRKALHFFLQSLSLQIEKMPAQHQVRWVMDVDPMEIF